MQRCAPPQPPYPVEVRLQLSRKETPPVFVAIVADITKSLVEMHGGSLDLQSKVGVGTTVTVRFPAERIVELQRDTELLNTAAKKVG